MRQLRKMNAKFVLAASIITIKLTRQYFRAIPDDIIENLT